MAEEIVVAPKSQCDIPSKIQYGSLSTIAPAWMMETAQISPGVHVARVMVRDDADLAPVRILNLGGKPAKFTKDQIICQLLPVETGESEHEEGTSADFPSLKRLLEDLPDDVPSEAKRCLEELLLDYRDVFSASETDLGQSKVSEHRIDTGEDRPVRPPSRKQQHSCRKVEVKEIESRGPEEKVVPRVNSSQLTIQGGRVGVMTVPLMTLALMISLLLSLFPGYRSDAAEERHRYSDCVDGVAEKVAATFRTERPVLKKVVEQRVRQYDPGGRPVKLEEDLWVGSMDQPEIKAETDAVKGGVE